MLSPWGLGSSCFNIDPVATQSPISKRGLPRRQEQKLCRQGNGVATLTLKTYGDLDSWGWDLSSSSSADALWEIHWQKGSWNNCSKVITKGCYLLPLWVLS